MHFKPLLAIILSVTVVGCSSSVQSDAPKVSQDASSHVQSNLSLAPIDSVTYELPGNSRISVLQEGEIDGVAGSYLLVIGDPDEPERFAMTALPAVESDSIWSEQAAEWEDGFLQKMTRKLLSEQVEFDGRQARHVVAEAGNGDDSVKIDVYYFNAGKWNYSVALTAPASSNPENGDLAAVRDSIHVR